MTEVYYGKVSRAEALIVGVETGIDDPEELLASYTEWQMMYERTQDEGNRKIALANMNELLKCLEAITR